MNLAQIRRLIDDLNGDLDVALREADEDWVAVGGALQRLFDATVGVEAAVGPGPNESAIYQHCKDCRQYISAIVVGLQCQDRLTQRIALIRTALDCLKGSLRSAQSWYSSEILLELKSAAQSYSTQRARLVDVRKHRSAGSEMVSTALNDSVELF